VATARLAIGFALLAGTLLCGPVAAQVERSGGGASAKLMQQYQQMATERTQLQAQNAQLKKDLEDAKKQLGVVQQQATAAKAGVGRRSQAELAAARASNETTQKSLDETKARMQELAVHFRETVATMRGIETERTQLQQQLAESRAAFDRCAEANYELYKVDNEVLDRYEHQGAFSYLGRAEPFTRIKRTRIENLVDEYRQRAEELRVKKATAAADGATTNNAAAASAASKPTTAPLPPPTPR
jgi:hypothetical protein